MSVSEQIYCFDLEELDKKIPVTFFSNEEKQGSEKYPSQECLHLGYLVKDGSNTVRSSRKQRVMCSNCGKKFGNHVSEFDVLLYRYRIKQILRELFFDGSAQVKIEEKWGIPQYMLSKFKRSVVEAAFEQIPNLVPGEEKTLPKGVLYGDETYMGTMGNSNTESVFCNENFEILSSEPLDEGNVGETIERAYSKISEKNKQRLRVLVTDGEGSYETTARNSNRRVIHVQQFHASDKLGQITINKYERFGPHLLRYKIHTHWKIFKSPKKEVGFRWEISFIQGKLKAGRGRPTKKMRKSKRYREWRQKKDEYHSKEFQKSGSARVFVNLETKKVSMRKGSKKWMQRILQRLLPIFSGKCITNNRIESKHSQIKRKGKLTKQADATYADKLFLITEYLVQNQCFPPISIEGMPLQKFLLKKRKRSPFQYIIKDGAKIKSQKTISGYL